MRSSVVSRGHRISYRAEGNGVPLVLLSGWTRWADTWWEAGYVSGLGDDYRVIAVDRLGHGESDKPHDPAEYLEHLIVSDIVAVLDVEQVDRALVWGFSMGARNAASLAVMEPTRVGALVCGGGGPLPGLDGRRERVLAFADVVKTVDGMTTWRRSMGRLTRRSLRAWRAMTRLRSLRPWLERPNGPPSPRRDACVTGCRPRRVIPSCE